MRHLDQELLAGIALGEPAPRRRGERLHLLLCRYCARELAELRAIVATGREGVPLDLRPPRPVVLTQIQAELAEDSSSDEALHTPPPGKPGAELSSLRPAARSVGRVPVAAIAAAIVVVATVGGVTWYRQDTPLAPDVVVVARATLQPLPNKSGEGTAELVRRDGVEQLSVTVRAGSPATGFEELWLINTDGRRMISLGVLPPDGRASYPVPVTANGALDGYSIVDISLEPFDGNAAHSRNSLLRGSLG